MVSTDGAKLCFPLVCDVFHWQNIGSAYLFAPTDVRSGPETINWSVWMTTTATISTVENDESTVTTPYSTTRVPRIRTKEVPSILGYLERTVSLEFWHVDSLSLSRNDFKTNLQKLFKLNQSTGTLRTLRLQECFVKWPASALNSRSDTPSPLVHLTMRIFFKRIPRTVYIVISLSSYVSEYYDLTVSQEVDTIALDCPVCVALKTN